MKKQVLVEKREVSLTWVNIEVDDKATDEIIDEVALAAAANRNDPPDWDKQYEHLTVLVK